MKMEYINYEDFQNICRICMSNCDTNINKNAVILDIFHKLTNIHFETNDELPQQICLKCVDFINEIHAFSMTCKQTHSALINCLTNYKNEQIKEEQEIIEETNEEIEIKEEITIEEHKIEFIKVEIDNDWEINDSSNKDVIELPVDLLPPVSTNIQTENEDDSLNIINSNGPKLSDSENSANIICKKKNKQIKSKLCIETSKQERKCEPPSVPKISNNMQRRRYKCDQCEKSFTRSQYLNDHKRVHTGERPYKCDQCGKSFAKSNSLIRHERMHTGEHPFICDQCGKSFTTSATLKTHIRVHTGERPYKCDLCKKSFVQLNHLKDHKRVHTGERPYKCDQCEKSFSTASDLKTHKRVHTGERPYKCDLCEKSFVQLGHLKYHKRVHSHIVK